MSIFISIFVCDGTKFTVINNNIGCLVMCRCSILLDYLGFYCPILNNFQKNTKLKFEMCGKIIQHNLKSSLNTFDFENL